MPVIGTTVTVREAFRPPEPYGCFRLWWVTLEAVIAKQEWMIPFLESQGDDELVEQIRENIDDLYELLETARGAVLNNDVLGET